jgi:hypothetical protein
MLKLLLFFIIKDQMRHNRLFYKKENDTPQYRRSTEIEKHQTAGGKEPAT